MGYSIREIRPFYIREIRVNKKAAPLIWDGFSFLLIWRDNNKTLILCVNGLIKHFKNLLFVLLV